MKKSVNVWSFINKEHEFCSCKTKKYATVLLCAISYWCVQFQALYQYFTKLLNQVCCTEKYRATACCTQFILWHMHYNNKINCHYLVTCINLIYTRTSLVHHPFSGFWKMHLCSGWFDIDFFAICPLSLQTHIAFLCFL